jgi:inner membrane protein involved in colicin E2 resistance
MLIPGAMIRNLISERAQTQLDVIYEIGSKWGFGKTLNGPVLSIPYYHYIEQDDKPYREIRFAHFLPGELEVDAEITPEVRYRGIYKTVVYTTLLKVSSYFDFPDTDKLNIERSSVLMGDAFVQVGITDMRGIQQALPFDWNQQVLEVEPGIPTGDISSSGFHVKISLDGKDHDDFKFQLNLNGSDHLYFFRWENPPASGCIPPGATPGSMVHFCLTGAMSAMLDLKQPGLPDLQRGHYRIDYNLAAGIFRHLKLTMILGACLVLLYVFLFILIQLQDYALLLGSIGLFVAMGVIMYTSRNVDWYSATSLKNTNRHIGF